MYTVDLCFRYAGFMKIKNVTYEVSFVSSNVSWVPTFSIGGVTVASKLRMDFRCPERSFINGGDAGEEVKLICSQSTGDWKVFRWLWVRNATLTLRISTLYVTEREDEGLPYILETTWGGTAYVGVGCLGMQPFPIGIFGQMQWWQYSNELIKQRRAEAAEEQEEGEGEAEEEEEEIKGQMVELIYLSYVIAAFEIAYVL